MPTSLQFADTSARFGLPFLFAGQAQKEFFVNQSLALTDALLHACVEGETSEPPAEPEDGECWLVSSQPTGQWQNQSGTIAARQAGTWLYVTPQAGMTIYNKATAQMMLFTDGWQTPQAPASPQGGSVIDVEARQAFTLLVAALTTAGIFSGDD